MFLILLVLVKVKNHFQSIKKKTASVRAANAHSCEDLLVETLWRESPTGFLPVFPLQPTQAVTELQEVRHGTALVVLRC